MTPQQLGRGEDENDDATMESAPPFLPTEAWIDAFTEQCTDELRLRSKRFALRRLNGLARAGGHVDDYAARELVQDILGDTLMGVRSWEPAAKSLQQHLEDVICSRVKHQRDRAKKFRHQRVDLFDPDTDRQSARGEIEASIQMGCAQGTTHDSMVARELLDQLRVLASKDRDVNRLLDAVEEGANTPADIIHTTGLSEKAFRSARGRLQRISERMQLAASPVGQA